MPGSPDGECLPYNTDEGLYRFAEGGQLYFGGRRSLVDSEESVSLREEGGK